MLFPIRDNKLTDFWSHGKGQRNPLMNEKQLIQNKIFERIIVF